MLVQILCLTPTRVEVPTQQAPVPFYPQFMLLNARLALAERTRYDGVDIITDFPPDAVHAHPILGWY